MKDGDIMRSWILKFADGVEICFKAHRIEEVVLRFRASEHGGYSIGGGER